MPSLNVTTGVYTPDPPGYVAPSFIPSLAERRAACAIPRGTLCTNLLTVGLLSPADAVSASKGNWPDVFAAAISGLSATDQAKAQISWAGAASIPRMHPLILTVQATIGLTDAQVDALFGIA